MDTPRHAVLLIPTSDSVITNWTPAYQPLQDAGHRVFIIQDSAWVNPEAQTPFTHVEMDISRDIRGAGGDGGGGRGGVSRIKRTALQAKLIYRAGRVLKQNEIDTLVVSNDNDPIANAFVNSARARHIPTVLHQAAGLVYLTDDPAHPANIKTPPPWWMRRLLRFTTDGRIGGHVDECWTQGSAWAPYLHNNRLEVVGNAYYRQFKSQIDAVGRSDHDEFLQSHNLEPGKPIVTFYSQPFGKMGLLDHDTLPRFYNSLAQLGEMLGERFNTVFKSHPLETEHRQYLDTPHLHVIETCDLSQLVAASRFAVSVFSAMAIQSRIAGVTTLGYHPTLFAPKYAQVLAEAFHHSSERIEDLAQTILNPPPTGTPNDDFQHKFDLDADTPRLIVDHLERLTRSGLNRR